MPCLHGYRYTPTGYRPRRVQHYTVARLFDGFLQLGIALSD